MSRSAAKKKPALRVVEKPTEAPPARADLELRIVPKEQAPFWSDVVARMVTDIKVRRSDGTTRHSVSWKPDQVMQVLTDGRGTLLLSFHGKRVVGAAIVCRDGDQFADQFDYLVWMAWAEPENKVLARQVREFTQDGIEDFARSKGARCLRWYSAREGWKRIAPQLGYTMTAMCFSKRLNEGDPRG